MVGYGSSTKLTKLDATQVGVINEKGFAFAGLLRVLITIAEVGASLLVPGGALVQTGIALAGATAQTGVDIVTDQVSPLNLGINFGSALIPGIVGGISQGSKIGKLNALVAELPAEEVAGIGKFGFFTNLNKDAGVSHILSTAEGGIDIGRLGLNLNPGLTPEQIERITNRIDSLRKSISGITGKANAVIEGVEGVEEDTRRILAKTGLSELDLLTLSRELDLLSGNERRSYLISFLTKKYGKERALEIVKDVIDTQEAHKLLNKIMREDRPPKDPSFVKRFGRALKKPSGSDFNDLVVQPTQAIFDAGDLGRAPVEFVYKKLSRSFKKILGTLGTAGKNLAKIDEAFVKAGGTLVNSTVILGYKELRKVGTANLILVSFYKHSTEAIHPTWKGKKTNNFGGKKPVFVEATDHQLARLRDEGMTYYQKRWAMSRGGAPLGLSAFGLGGLTNEAQLLLPFINTALLRNVLSLASNVIGNVEATVSGEGGFAKGWSDKFKRSFSRSWKNRLGRLFGRTVIGGVAGAKFGAAAGAITGREAQRLMGAVTTALNNATPNSSFSTQFKREMRARALVSVNSNLTRRVRRTNKNNNVTQSFGVKRKLQMGTRTFGVGLKKNPLRKIRF